MEYSQLSRDQLSSLETDLCAQYETLKDLGLDLDLTRGKPCDEQVTLSNELDGILDKNYFLDGTDVRNYGGLTGLPSAKTLFASMIDVAPEHIIIGGNASLTLMHQCVTIMYYLGLDGPSSAWAKEGKIKFICPVPGYDRHFAICEHLGIEMITVDILDDGPDMDAVERLVSSDPLIKGIWCVPRFSNPTGCVYSEATVRRLAALSTIAGPNFKLFYDNAYAVHSLYPAAAQLFPIMPVCEALGTSDSIFMFGSTSKITFAGAGVSFMATGKLSLDALTQHLEKMTIGPDKVNQARHVHLLKDKDHLTQIMNKHAQIIRPRFDAVLNILERDLAGTGAGSWLSPQGGYFISFQSRNGLAKLIVDMAKNAGVKLTPAGSTYPLMNDPTDSNLRIAPTVPSIQEVEQATTVFTTCTKLATVRQLLATK